jgi:hypothetical protein
VSIGFYVNKSVTKRRYRAVRLRTVSNYNELGQDWITQKGKLVSIYQYLLNR